MPEPPSTRRQPKPPRTLEMPVVTGQEERQERRSPPRRRGWSGRGMLLGAALVAGVVGAALLADPDDRQETEHVQLTPDTPTRREVRNGETLPNILPLVRAGDDQAVGEAFIEIVNYWLRHWNDQAFEEFCPMAGDDLSVCIRKAGEALESNLMANRIDSLTPGEGDLAPKWGTPDWDETGTLLTPLEGTYFAQDGRPVKVEFSIDYHEDYFLEHEDLKVGPYTDAIGLGSLRVSVAP